VCTRGSNRVTVGGPSTFLLGVILMATAWDLGQRFSLRVSTMLLLWLLCLVSLGATQRFLPAPMAVWITDVLNIFGAGAWFVFLVVAIFSLAFLLASLYRRRPQVQYLVEFAIGTAGFFLLPVS
jgi:hypothetical protein